MSRPTKCFLNARCYIPRGNTIADRANALRYKAEWIARGTGSTLYVSKPCESQAEAVKLARAWIAKRPEYKDTTDFPERFDPPAPKPVAEVLPPDADEDTDRDVCTACGVIGLIGSTCCGGVVGPIDDETKRAETFAHMPSAAQRAERYSYTRAEVEAAKRAAPSIEDLLAAANEASDECAMTEHEERFIEADARARAERTDGTHKSCETCGGKGYVTR